MPNWDKFRCQWVEDADSVWSTGCNQSWVFVDGEIDDKMRFCCYCGKRLALLSFDNQTEDEEGADA